MIMRWFAGICLAAILLVPGQALAQGGMSPRVSLADELDRTDRRIEAAAMQVAGVTSPPAQATFELSVARDLQSRARSAFVAGQPVVAGRATMDARQHADRAIAILHDLPDPGRVADQLQRTADLLARAQDRLQGCDDARALALLKVAADMQQKAMDRAGESKYLAALQLTMSARERLQKAVQLCGGDGQLTEAVDRALQRTSEVISRALDAVGADARPAQREALARARALQAQAQAEAQQARGDVALRLTLRARTLAQWAMRPGRGAGPER